MTGPEGLPLAISEGDVLEEGGGSGVGAAGSEVGIVEKGDVVLRVPVQAQHTLQFGSPSAYTARHTTQPCRPSIVFPSRPPPYPLPHSPTPRSPPSHHTSHVSNGPLLRPPLDYSRLA